MEQSGESTFPLMPEPFDFQLGDDQTRIVDVAISDAHHACHEDLINVHDAMMQYQPSHLSIIA